MQIDPIGMSAVSLMAPQTLNMYAYCGNDPINYIDPSGLSFGSFFRWLGNLIMSLFRSRVARRIAIRFVVNYVVSGGNFGVAVRSIVPDVLSALGLAPPRYAVTPGWNSNLPYPYILGGISPLSKYVIQNLVLIAKNAFPCPPTLDKMMATFGRFMVNLLKDESGHLTDNQMENGGWIYQRKNGNLFFLRAEKFGGAWRRSAKSIDLGNPPNLKGARVVAKAHTHPYSSQLQNVINEGRGYGGPSETDFDNSKNQQMPSMVAHQPGITPDNRNIYTVEWANIGVTSIKDINCK